MLTRQWSEEEILDQAACVMTECGERATRCFVLQIVLDELIESVGPWKLAHFLATTKNHTAAAALSHYLERNWPDCAHKVTEMLEAASWQKGEEELEREFGGD